MVEFNTRTGNKVETLIKKYPAVDTNSLIKLDPPENIVEFTTRSSNRVETSNKEQFSIMHMRKHLHGQLSNAVLTQLLQGIISHIQHMKKRQHGQHSSAISTQLLEGILSHIQHMKKRPHGQLSNAVLTQLLQEIISHIHWTNIVLRSYQTL